MSDELLQSLYTGSDPDEEPAVSSVLPTEPAKSTSVSSLPPNHNTSGVAFHVPNLTFIAEDGGFKNPF